MSSLCRRDSQRFERQILIKKYHLQNASGCKGYKGMYQQRGSITAPFARLFQGWFGTQLAVAGSHQPQLNSHLVFLGHPQVYLLYLNVSTRID